MGNAAQYTSSHARRTPGSLAKPAIMRNSNKKQSCGEGDVSRALSVYHGHFGRATLYELNRPMTTHAHREGHLIFYLDGAPATARVSGKLHGLTERCAIAVNPWEPHGFNPGDIGTDGLFLVLYIDRSWFSRMGRAGHGALAFGRGEIEITPHIRAIMHEVVSLLEDRSEERRVGKE